MGIQAFVPSGGGGTPGFDYINSVNLVTYNRSWAQAGAPGNYVLASYNKNSGYAYFVGSGVTTGIPLGYVAIVNHAFTRIDIVAPTNDYISLFKASVKTTTVFSNALDGFASFPSVISSSGNFVLPNNALPLINVLLVGGGGGGAHYGGGGGGGGCVKLTAYQAVGTTSVSIGTGGASSGTGTQGGDTYFGNVYAIGGGFGRSNGGAGSNGANGGGGSFHSGNTGAPGTGITQTASTGLGSVGSPTYNGGFSGGSHSFSGSDHYGAGGGGAGGVGANRTGTGGVAGGPGHAFNIEGTTRHYGSGGGGAQHDGPSHAGIYSTERYFGAGGQGQGSSSTIPGMAGAVIVRYYIP
jgi:hypothetical protein